MKTFSEHSDLEEYKKTADITQRRKQARRMRLLSKQSGFKMKKKRTLMKVRDVGKITKSAKKQTIKMFRNKLYPNYNDMPIPKKIKTYSYYGNKTKFKNNSFDVIFIYMVLHHLQNDKEYYETVNEIHRILKPNGLVFITEPGRYKFFRFIEYLFYLFSFISTYAKTFSNMMEEEKKEQHYFLLNHHKVKNYLKKKKFKILKNKYFLYSWIYVGLKKT